MTETGFELKEMKIAFEILNQCPENDIYIIPVRLDECNPSPIIRLSDARWIDLFPESEYREALKKILYIVGPRAFSLRNKPTQLSLVQV